MRSLAIESLSVRGFRNLVAVDVELGPRLNVFSGDNGQGKTSLLEATYVLATSRSFRTSRMNEVVCTSAEAASVRAVIADGEEKREQSVGLKPGARVVRIDGKRPPSLAAYAVATPVVAFHPGAVALSSGSSAERRKLLDRVALYASPSSLADAEAFSKAIRARQRVLEVRGEGALDLQHWEELIVRHGLALSEARERAAANLLPRAVVAFSRLGPAGVSLQGRYVRGGPAEAEAFRAALEGGRKRDRSRGSASVGPHRDELALELGGRAVRGMASQGQHRMVVLALELAEIEVVAERRDARPILLLDDVSSELDQARTASLFENLREERGQVLLTTTRPELIEGGLSAMEERKDFSVVGGRIEGLTRGVKRGV
jgi:DNA replication and repair protein RecF